MFVFLKDAEIHVNTKLIKKILHISVQSRYVIVYHDGKDQDITVNDYNCLVQTIYGDN